MTKNPINLKTKVLDLLSRRDYSYQELYQKLCKYSEDLDLIKKVLDEMVAKNFINEERFIANFIHNKSQRYGSLKIKYLLKHKTDNSQLVNQIYQESDIDELASARQIWQRKFGQTPAKSWAEKAKQIRFLLSRGFNMGIIQKVLAISEFDDEVNN